MKPIKLPETFHPANSGDHAFVDEDGKTEVKTAIGYPGAMMRDMFAMRALQAVLSSSIKVNINNEPCIEDCNLNQIDLKKQVAEFCYDIAEYMMDEKRKRDAMDKESDK